MYTIGSQRRGQMVEHSQYSIERLLNNRNFFCLDNLFHSSSFLSWNRCQTLSMSSCCSRNNYHHTMEDAFPIYCADIVIWPTFSANHWLKDPFRFVFRNSNTFSLQTTDCLYRIASSGLIENPNLFSAASSHFDPKTFSTSIPKPSIIGKSDNLGFTAFTNACPKLICFSSFLTKVSISLHKYEGSLAFPSLMLLLSLWAG